MFIMNVYINYVEYIKLNEIVINYNITIKYHESETTSYSLAICC